MMITPSAEDKKDANKHERATTNNKVATSSSSSSRHWSSAGFRNPRIVRVSRSFGGKDRHSKVCTVRGLRDRRIRLSVPTAVQLYDLQDRLGLGQPSKVIDWLIDNTKPDIDNLPPLHFPPQFHHHNHPLDNNLNTKPLTTDDFSFFPHKTHFSSPTNISPYLGLGQLGMFPQIIDSSSSSSSTSSASSSSSLSPSLFFGGQLLGNPTPYTTATDHQRTMMMMMIGHDQMAAARSTSSRMINVINNNNNNSSTGLSGHVLQNYSLMPPSSSDINIEAPSSSIRSIFTGPRFLSHGGFESRHGKDHHG